MEMSSPDHPNYGKHFRTHDEMKRMLQPSAASVDAVREWLEGAGITNIEQDADWMTFYTDVETANELLDANFQYYINSVKHVERLRTLEYSIPHDLVQHVNLVTPTTRFGQLHANRHTLHSKAKAADETFRKAALSTGNCNSAITPQCLKDLYSVGDYEADPNNGNKVAFASYLEQYARYSDLSLFEKKLAPWANGENFTVIQYNGGLNDQNSPADSSEANLDLQYIVGVSSPVPVTEFSTAGRAPLVPDLDQPDPSNNNNEPYLDFLQNVIKMDDKDLPQVISTSYGEDEQVRLIQPSPIHPSTNNPSPSRRNTPGASATCTPNSAAAVSPSSSPPATRASAQPAKQTTAKTQPTSHPNSPPPVPGSPPSAPQPALPPRKPSTSRPAGSRISGPVQSTRTRRSALT